MNEPWDAIALACLAVEAAGLTALECQQHTRLFRSLGVPEGDINKGKSMRRPALAVQVLLTSSAGLAPAIFGIGVSHFMVGGIVGALTELGVVFGFYLKHQRPRRTIRNDVS